MRQERRSDPATSRPYLAVNHAGLEELTPQTIEVWGVSAKNIAAIGFDDTGRVEVQHLRCADEAAAPFALPVQRTPGMHYLTSLQRRARGESIIIEAELEAATAALLPRVAAHIMNRVFNDTRTGKIQDLLLCLPKAPLELAMSLRIGVMGLELAFAANDMEYRLPRLHFRGGAFAVRGRALLYFPDEASLAEAAVLSELPSRIVYLSRVYPARGTLVAKIQGGTDFVFDVNAVTPMTPRETPCRRGSENNTRLIGPPGGNGARTIHGITTRGGETAIKVVPRDHLELGESSIAF